MTNKNKNTGLDIPNFCTSTKPKAVRKGKDVKGRNRVAMFALLMVAFLVGYNLQPGDDLGTNCEVTPKFDSIISDAKAEDAEIAPELTPEIRINKSVATPTPAAPEVKEPVYTAPETPKAPEVKPTPTPAVPTPTPIPPTPLPTPETTPEPTPEVPACRVITYWEYDEPQEDGSLIHFGATTKAPGANAININSEQAEFCD